MQLEKVVCMFGIVRNVVELYIDDKYIYFLNEINFIFFKSENRAYKCLTISKMAFQVHKLLLSSYDNNFS